MKKEPVRQQLRQTTLATVALAAATMVVLFASSAPYSFAETQETIPLGVEGDESLSLEKTTTTMSVPKDNTLPWATVKGTVDDPAQGYPVIIQFFDQTSLEDEPVHVAQVDLKGDDTYEYKFRIRDVDLNTGIATNIFEGDYTVKIFKVVVSDTLNAI